MDRERWDRVQQIFHQVSNCKFEEQDALLRSLCNDEADLSSEVQAMLDADRGGESLLDRGLSDVAYRTVGIPFDENAIREFGPYRLQKILGEGGMGVVWLARRADTGHLVAIKFLPNAALSPARRNRFALEIRTLAKLRHPNIARFYDAGTLADGTPWFVMEYVEGVPLSEYLAPHHSVREKLSLFRKLCDAVQYAHGQEIIHRDLKPSNI
jgi:eukaryotic-like serine/threonine-protein kinase